MIHDNAELSMSISNRNIQYIDIYTPLPTSLP